MVGSDGTRAFSADGQARTALVLSGVGARQARCGDRGAFHRRLGLLRAIADDPQVLLLDEPTSALDPPTGALVEELIKFQTLVGRIVVLVSHDAAQIGRLAQSRLRLAAAEAPRADESVAA